jgi:hypothetical protein
MRELANATASDAARRCSDAFNLATLAGHVGKWLAIKLHDGSSDGTPYDFKRDAMRFQLHEQLCMYLKVTPDGMTPGAAQSLLDLHRKVYDGGFRFTDPDQEIGIPMNREDIPWN